MQYLKDTSKKIQNLWACSWGSCHAEAEKKKTTQKNEIDFFDLTVNKSDKKQENIKQMNHCGWS